MTREEILNNTDAELLNNKTYTEMTLLKIENENLIQEEKSSQKAWSNIWITIIGIYYLIKLIEEIIKITLLVIAGQNINNILSTLI